MILYRYYVFFLMKNKLIFIIYPYQLCCSCPLMIGSSSSLDDDHAFYFCVNPSNSVLVLNLSLVKVIFCICGLNANVKEPVHTIFSHRQ